MNIFSSYVLQECISELFEFEMFLWINIFEKSYYMEDNSRSNSPFSSSTSPNPSRGGNH